MNFDKAIDRILSHEGGYTANPADRGNWTSGKIGHGKLNGTKFGISAITYPDIDIKNLTLEQAKSIYKRDFWDQLDGDSLDDGVAYQLLDFAVNSGIKTAIKALQRSIETEDDGYFGPMSKQALAGFSESDLIMLVLSERLEFMVNISSWLTFSRGWVRRIAANLRYGAMDS